MWCSASVAITSAASSTPAAISTPITSCGDRTTKRVRGRHASRSVRPSPSHPSPRATTARSEPFGRGYRTRYCTMPSCMTDCAGSCSTPGRPADDIERAEARGLAPVARRWTVSCRPVPRVMTPPVSPSSRGVDEERLRRLWRAVGFPDVPDGLAVFTDADVEAARRLARRGLGPGTDFATLLQQVRVISASAARIASVVADDFGDIVRRERAAGVDDDDDRARLDRAIQRRGPRGVARATCTGSSCAPRCGAGWRSTRHRTSRSPSGSPTSPGYTELSAELDTAIGSRPSWGGGRRSRTTPSRATRRHGS